MKFSDLVFELWRFTALGSFRIDDSGTQTQSSLELRDADLSQIAATEAKRKLEYQRGRAIARLALTQIDSKLDASELAPRLEGGAVWPTGTCGSISHTKSSDSAVFAVVVSKTSKFAAVGVDIELSGRQTKPKLIERITTASERERLPDLDPLLVLSIKESVFKALHPLTNVYFGFQDAELVELAEGEFKIQLNKDLSERFFKGTELTGALFKIADVQVALTTVKPERGPLFTALK